MITFYFRGMPTFQGKFQRGVDSLCSWNCSYEELKREFGPLGKNESICMIAEFDDSHTPWLLRQRHGGYSFKDMRAMREDFPKFYIFGTDGDIWDADSFGKTPVMRGPSSQASTILPSYP